MNANATPEQYAAPAASAAPVRRRGGFDWLLIAATVATGLIAGVYYCFTCAIMPALAGADDRTFIDVLQRVNVKIENPVFFASFLGAFLLPLAALVTARRRRGTVDAAVLRWTLAALALYTVGALTTMGFNIPLNNELKDAGDPAKIADPAKVREDFENAWIAWNIVRTVVSTLAIGCLARALLLRGRTADARH
jgi:uncharacterized membrane protein